MNLVERALRRIRQQPAWPDSGGLRYLFLVDASSPLERRILKGWVRANRPAAVPDAEVRASSIPKTRRRRPEDWRMNPRLWARLNRSDEQLAVPMRLVWLAPGRDGERAVTWRNVFTFGDPRDPGWLRQHWILRRHPDRCRIVLGEPATVADLRGRWSAFISREGTPTSSFAEYVALQASLALEVAERRLRGNRYKVPAFVAADLMNQRAMVADLADIADTSGTSYERVRQRAARYLEEIAATHSPYVIDLVARAIKLLIKTPYGGELHYDRDVLRRLYDLGQEYPLIFLPSHKSNLDHLVLQLALYENDLPPNHTAGGINMNFFPVGPLVRRSGVFFIRRTFKDNPLYKLVLKRYLYYLLEKRFSLEWYIEGGRSRSGKLRPPRYGMLGYVTEAYRHGAAGDVFVIPVAIAYDQIQDVGGFAVEQRGGGKQSEGLSYLLRAIRSLRLRYGSIYLRFGEPIPLSSELPAPDVNHPGREEVSLAVQKLAFDVCARINEVTPLTPISLVTLALLGSRDRALSVEQTTAVLEGYLDFVKQRDLPTTRELRLDTPDRVRAALEALVAHRVVARFDDGPETVYAIGPDQHLAAAYYRNTIIHFFVTGAIAEVAMLAAGEAAGSAAREALWDEAMALRDLLKFEFFFRRTDLFLDDITAELDLQDPTWRERVDAGEARASLLGFRPYMADWVLRPFLEAYRVVADVLASRPDDAGFDEKRFLRDCFGLGRQYLLQRRIGSAESISQELFVSCLSLARNRELIDPAPGVGEAREAFAAEIREALRRVDAVAVLAAGRHAGLIG